MDNTAKLTVLSLCAGYGGLELGLSRALANPLQVVAVEIEAYALANLVAKAEEGKLAIEALWPDLRTFPSERFRGCFDFVLAGYPCQPFSVAGKRQGADDPRHLWPAIARIVEAVEPLWCFFENVPGHLSLRFPDVYCSLRAMDYKVEAGLFTAAECGAPHKRQRLFILAHREGGGRGIVRGPYDAAGCGQSESGGELADAQRGQGRLRLSERGQNQSLPDTERAGEVLADAATQRIQGSEPAGPILTRRPPDEQGTQWPARPGQPQYEWEEPRVVDNAKGHRVSPTEQQGHHTGNQQTSGQGQTQSGVGRATNGTSFRVDRLRLLGNGVVPQQAEKAFRELYETIVRIWT